MHLLRQRAVVLLALFALAFALRVAVAGWWEARLPEGARFGFGDSEGYWQLGLAIAHGEPYRYGTHRIFRTPGYPLLLAALFEVAGDEVPTLAARVLTALVSSLAIGGVYWLGRQLFDEPTARLAALGAAIYPGLVAMGALLLSEGPFLAAMAWQLALWVKGWQAASRRAFALWLVAAGLTGGIATLIRPGWLLFVPFALVLALLFSAERRRHALAGLWLMLGLCLVLAPWWVRNYRVSGHLVLTTLQVGPSLYDGISPQATGASNMDFVPRLQAELRQQPAATDDSFEYRFDRFTRQKAIEWAAEHPLEVLKLAAVKLQRLWNLWPNEPQFRRPLFRLVIAGSFLPVLVLAAAGAWKYARRGWPYVLCLLPAAYLSLLHMVFVSSIRYRQPAMLALLVLAAATALDWTGRRSRRKSADRSATGA